MLQPKRMKHRKMMKPTHGALAGPPRPAPTPATAPPAPRLGAAPSTDRGVGHAAAKAHEASQNDEAPPRRPGRRRAARQHHRLWRVRYSHARAGVDHRPPDRGRSA